MRIRRISGSIGAELLDINLHQVLSTNLIEDIKKSLHEHLVIFFRDQDLTPSTFMRFAKCMGEPVEYPFVKGLADYPCVIEVKKLEHEKINFGGIWHSDTTYLQEPPMGSMLWAHEVPEFGGDTLFANQYMAWETLSTTMQSLLINLKGISSSSKADVSRTREDRRKTEGKDDAKSEYRAIHPLVRTHPITGRKSLYINVAHTVGIEGLEDSESKPLLNFLFSHQVKTQFTCRFQWRNKSLAFWDNRCSLHNPINDYHGYRRIMHRITLAGDRPR